MFAYQLLGGVLPDNFTSMRTIKEMFAENEYIYAVKNNVSVFYSNEGTFYKYRVHGNGIEHARVDFRDIPTDARVVPVGTYKKMSKGLTELMQAYCDDAVEKYGKA